MLKVMNVDAADIRIPRRLHVQLQRRRRKPVRGVISAAFAVAGAVLLLMTETSLSCGVAGTVCMAAALMVKR